MRNFLLLAALYLLIQCCSVDPDLNPPCGEPGGWGHATIISPENKPYRNAPSANPLNANAFSYIADDNGIEGYWKYDMISKQKYLIAEVDAWDAPDWSNKDWIVFGSNSQIFICKSNGDSLKQLTFSSKNYEPSWSPSGDRIIFHSLESNFRVIDMYGNIITNYDSTIYAGNLASWSPDGQKIAFISTYNEFDKSLIAYFFINEPYKIYYLEGTEIRYDGSGILGPLDWYPDSQTILFNYWGEVYSVNIVSGEISLVKKGLNCMSYYYHTILPDGKSFITVRSESTYDAETNTEFLDYDLVKIHPDGTEEIIPY